MGNLQPGTAAPQTGTYACSYCGPGGIAESLVVGTNALMARANDHGGPLRNADITTPVSGRVTFCDFAAGTRLPQCPTCGPATGWDLITGTVEDYLQRRVEVRESIFNSLGITRSEPVDAREAALDRLTVIRAAPGRRRWWPFRR